MSKRALKKYLSDLDKAALETQILDLYERIPQVKTFYDFVFNPKEDKMVEEAKMKISNEYFPLKRKRPRKRRSIAHKYIKQFKTLGMDPSLLADVMLYNIEIAQTYHQHANTTPEAFYKSLGNSFKEAMQWLRYHSLTTVFSARIERIVYLSEQQQWPNADQFDMWANDDVD
ncbi:MAG: DUF6155 family protein [Dokdonia sp.]|jgi:hypothetical protein